MWPPTPDARQLFRTWRQQLHGDARAAGNLVALEIGLRPIDAGWTEREIEQLLFLRWAISTGRLRP